MEYASGNFTKLLPTGPKGQRLQCFSPRTAAPDSRWEPQNRRGHKPVLYLMFTDFLRGIVVKPGFSKGSFPPPPSGASIQFLCKEVGPCPLVVSMVSAWVPCCGQLLGTGLNTQLPSDSWITVLP